VLERQARGLIGHENLVKTKGGGADARLESGTP